jgi:dTDP-4-amino-4,6-dideoxygalactose transaminase
VFWEETGIPVIIDGAACFDTIHSIPASRPGRSPIMVSLHATKVLGTGEGGLVVSTDDAVVRRVRQVCNFGIWGAAHEQILGYNGKLSEYHAAVGLAALDAWPERREALEGRTQRYLRALQRLPGIEMLPRYGEGWVSAYCTVIVPEAGAVGDRLTQSGIENRRWWQDGVHRFAAYRGFSKDDLVTTEKLATSVLSLPFSHDITDEEIDRVVDSLEAALSAGR